MPNLSVNDNALFWLVSPHDQLGPDSLRLLELVEVAHAESARRSNPSTVAFINAWNGSGDYGKALASAILTLGGPHAPLRQTYDLIVDDDPVARANEMIEAGERVPGWGSSFHRNGPDPIWQDVASFLRERFGDYYDVLWGITAMLHACRKRVFPNPSAYTATAGFIVGLPPEILPYLFIKARLPAWSAMIIPGFNGELSALTPLTPT